MLTQIGWKSHIQSVVTEGDLVSWYEKALKGKYSKELGKPLLSSLVEEIAQEFPSVDELPESIEKRHYEEICDPFWS